MSGPRFDAPDSQNSRIFVGNVAINTDEDVLAEHFKKHGNVVGCMVLKGFAFVQFEKAEDAQKAIDAENGVEFMGRKMDVKVARKKASEEKKEELPQEHKQQQQLQQQQYQQQHPQLKEQPQHFQRNQPSFQEQHFGGNDRQWNDNRGGRGAPRGGRGGFRGRQAPYNRRDQYMENDYQGESWDRQNRHGPESSYGYGDDYNGRGGFRGPNVDMVDSSEHKNDCEIVCINKQQRHYAEMIEARLRNLGLRIDILFPNPDIPITKILENITSRGILFAVVIMPINEQHQSITLNVLQGVQQEHRNMPLEDAIAFMAKNFEALVEGKSAGISGSDGIPEDIRTVIGFLVDNRPLSVMEYDKLIRFLAGRREGMLRLEYGDNIPPSLANPPIGPPVEPAFKAKQDELFDRIIQVLNKPAPVKEAKPSSAPMSIAPELNASLQRAIDSLIKTGPNLLSQMNNQTGSSTTGSHHSQTGSGYRMSSSYGRDNY